MRMIRQHKSAFTRQIHESVRITYGPATVVLNRKAEWNGNCIPRLAIEEGEMVTVEMRYH